MSTARSLVAALFVLAPLAAVAACSSFSAGEAAVDAGEDATPTIDSAPDGAIGNGEPPDGAIQPDASDAGDAAPPSTLIDDDFDTSDFCSAWTPHGATFTWVHDGDGNGGSTGYCEICVSDDSVNDPELGASVERVFSTYAPGNYRLMAFTRASMNNLGPPTGTNELALLFDNTSTGSSFVGPVQITTNAWTFDVPVLAPYVTGDFALHAFITIGGGVGQCFDVDDVTLQIAQ